MTEVFDVLQILVWAVTYGLIIAHSFREKGMRMPFFAGALNLVWEITALTQAPHWGHVIWCVLNVVIFFFNINNLSRNEWKAAYIFCTALAVVLANVIAVYITPFGKWMLASVFCVDLLMATEYLLAVRKIAIRGKIAIAITRLLGDFFAWMAYLTVAWCVALTGLVVLLLNMTYLCCCLEEKQLQNKKKR